MIEQTTPMTPEQLDQISWRLDGARRVADLAEWTPAEYDTVREQQRDTATLLAEVARLRARVEELVRQRDDALVEIATAEADGELGPVTPLRWGLDDVEWGDDDSTTVLLSGPGREPYTLELDPERAAAMRGALAGPNGDQSRADVLREVVGRLAARAMLYGSSATVNRVMRDLTHLADEADAGRGEGRASALPWAARLSEGELAALLEAVADAAVPHAPAAERLAALEDVLAEYRLIAETDRAQAAAPGPDEPDALTAVLDAHSVADIPLGGDGRG